MKECTQPELWANRPGSDASEEEVARYLEHLAQCAFHAEIENAEDRTVRGLAAFAISDAAAPEKENQGRAIPLTLVLKIAAAIAFIAAVFLLPLYFLRTKSTPERVVVPTASPLPSSSPTQEAIANNAVTPAPSTTPSVNAGRPLQTSLKDVKRIYVAEVDGAYYLLLRAALIDELKQSGKFTVVDRAAEADAVMDIESTRGPTVRLQLVNRAGKPLWFTTQSTDDQSGLGTRQVAARVVRALADEAK
jgi:hypothetical protein